MKPLVKFLLLMTIISLCLSTTSLASEPNTNATATTNEISKEQISRIVLNLPLPKPLEINGNFQYNQKQFKEVLIIYDNYLNLSEVIYELLKDNILLQKNNSILEEQFIEQKKITKELEIDRNFVYSLREKEIKEYEEAERINTIKIGLYSGGAAIVGIAAGILIGVFGI